jgi:hypothetical protein
MAILYSSASLFLLETIEIRKVIEKIIFLCTDLLKWGRIGKITSLYMQSIVAKRFAACSKLTVSFLKCYNSAFLSYFSPLELTKFKNRVYYCTISKGRKCEAGKSKKYKEILKQKVE